FYKRGKVFRVLWPELAGDASQNMTIATARTYHENIFCKIRWFVVVREGYDSCTCFRSIQTYGSRGVPRNKEKRHHAIMYTGDVEPQPLPSEQIAGESSMGPSIPVISAAPYHTMDERSRVNFIKVYTVEHYVKTEDFGHV
ncbi:hypothetical protein BDW02DRAFT_483724, partial [Decorospora gaudefroyi]